MGTRKMHLSAREYDLSINWEARLKREIPVLKKLFGPPGERPLLDAGCGTGRQAIALAREGYDVVAADKSKLMVEFARRQPGGDSPRLTWCVASYAQLPQRRHGPYAGIYCVGNSLSAAGSERAVRQALRSFAGVLAPGGTLFIQVLNYPPMRKIVPCVKGPIHFSIDGVEHVRVRLFDFGHRHADVTNITLKRDKKWTVESMRGRIFTMNPVELRHWSHEAGLRVAATWGSYAVEPFDPRRSIDLILIAERSRRRR